MNDRAALLDRFGRVLLSVALVLVVLGALALLLAGDWRIVGAGLFGAAAVVGTGLAFYLVGRSEDRARARARRRTR